MDRRWITIGLLVTTMLGCARTDPAPAPQTPAAQRVQPYADLPGLRSAPHPKLKGELALLTQERMTPQLIDADLAELRTKGLPATGNRQASAGRDALSDALPAISRPMLAAQLDEIYSGGPLTLSPVKLERARETLSRYAANRPPFRAAVELCGERGLDVRLCDGPFADVEFLDPLTLGCRLEALAAADGLAENQPDDALVPLDTMLRAARVLAEEWNVAARITAVNIRADALHVVEAIATHREATRQTHERLLELLVQHTADWPPDAAAWIGDRAAGLIAYELVRDGYYLSLLEQSEVKKLQERNLLSATAKAVMRNIDADELFYLDSLRQIIESCRRPYHERVSVLTTVRRELAQREHSGDFPLIAGRLLLTDFETGHRRQAEDLARVTAWKLALAIAAGRQPQALSLSPVTGEALRVQVTPLEVQVAGVLSESDSPIVVPIRPLAQQARAP